MVGIWVPYQSSLGSLVQPKPQLVHHKIIWHCIKFQMIIIKCIFHSYHHPILTCPKHRFKINLHKCHEYLQAARSRSSCTRMVPDIIKPRPNPGNMYALLAWWTNKQNVQIGPCCWGNFFFFKCLVKISGAYIIDLARHKHFALILNRRKWAPTCKNGTSLMVIHKNKGTNKNTYE